MLHVGLRPEPVHRLGPRLEVLKHRLEAFPRREVGLVDVAAVDHHGKHGLTLSDSSLVDEGPDIGGRREDDPLVRRDSKELLSGSNNLLNFHTKLRPGHSIQHHKNLDGHSKQDPHGKLVEQTTKEAHKPGDKVNFLLCHMGLTT